MGKWETVEERWLYRVDGGLRGMVIISPTTQKCWCYSPSTDSVYFETLAEAKAWVEAVCALGGTDE